MKRRRQRGDECGYAGDGGETEDDREWMNVDDWEVGVKQRTIEK